MKSKNILILSSIFVLTVGISIIGFNNDKTINELKTIEKPIIKVDTVKLDTFSEANLIIELFDNQIKEPNIVLAQAKLETGNFKSYLFKKSNNLFGFRDFNGYKAYKTWKHSVLAYKNWQDKKYKGGDYYLFLERIKYAEDTLYCNKLKEFK